MVKKYPTKEELLEYFIVNDDWSLTRIKRIMKGRECGDVVKGTTSSSGYKTIKFKGQLYQLHRIIWIMINGDIPLNYNIDHIDRNKSNNNINNLRLATTSENAMNVVNEKSNTGIKGILSYETTSKSGITYRYYRCSIMVDNKKRSKNFPYNEDGLIEAKRFIKILRKELHGEFSCNE